MTAKKLANAPATTSAKPKRKGKTSPASANPAILPPAATQAGGALNPGLSPGLANPGENRTIPFNLIDVCALNPRKTMDPAELAELKASVKAKGILQSIIVRPAGDRFEAVIGKRRHHVLGELIAEGTITADFGVPCHIRDLTDSEVIELGLMENVIRAAMTPLETAEAMAELANRGVDAEVIAAMFGYEARRVKGTVAIGRLIAPARDLVRTGARSLDWAKVMTLAPAVIQEDICREIEENASRLIQPWEVRRRVEGGSLLARNALFDIEAYKQAGGIAIEDLFNTVDSGTAVLIDSHLFWKLQDAAIEAKQAELEAEGWALIEMMRDSTPRLQDYARTDEPSQGFCIIEVSSTTGQVEIHKGLVKPQDLNAKSNAATPIKGSRKGVATPAAQAAPGETPADGDPFEEQIDLEAHIENQVNRPVVVDPTNGTPSDKQATYAAAQRTAIIQNTIAGNPTLAIAVAILALDNHPDASVKSNVYRYPAQAEFVGGPEFQALRNRQSDRALEYAQAGLTMIEQRHAKMLPFLLALGETKLNQLFAQIMAERIGQSAKSMDSSPTSLLNQIAAIAGIDTRKHWQPDMGFFELYQADQLRALARTLLPRESQVGIEGASRKSLARLLADSIARAAANGFDPEVNTRINAWRPAMMNFPAVASPTEAPADEGDASGLFEIAGGEVESAVESGLDSDPDALFSDVDEQSAAA